MAGTPMSRRAQFQFGATLPRARAARSTPGSARSPRGGTVTLIPPTDHHHGSRSRRTPSTASRSMFQLAPDTEAPAEMHMFYPGTAGR